jgi:hypothetical protein
MTIDGFLTLVALIVAVVAVIPSAMRRAIALKFGFCEWFVIVAGFLSVLFLEYYDTAKVLLRIPSIIFANRYKITANNFAFLLVILCSMVLFLSTRWKGIQARRMEKLKKLVDTLVEGELFADVIEIIIPNLTMISSIRAKWRTDDKQTERQRRRAQAVSDIIRTVFLSPRLVDYIARFKPYVAIEMMRIYCGHEDLRFCRYVRYVPDD